MKHFLSRVALAAMLTAAGAVASAAPPIPEVHSHAEIAKHFDKRAAVRVLNVWATWCTPCVAEMPALQAIHADYRRRGVSLVAVSMDTDSAVARSYGARVTPHVFIVDSKGKVRYRGYVDDSAKVEERAHMGVTEALDALLAGSAIKTASTKAFGCSIKWKKTS